MTEEQSDTDWMELLEDLAESDEEEGALGRHSLLLASLVILLVALPVFEVVSGGGTRFSILLSLVLTAAVYVNSTQHWTLIAAIGVGGGAILGTAWAEVTGSVPVGVAADVLGLVLLGFTTLLMLNTLLHAERVSRDTVVGAICVYLLIGLCFAMTFILMVAIQPGCLEEAGVAIGRSALDSSAHSAKILYYSFVTLTTLGYGDITPVSELAQMMAVAEAVIGQLYIAIFIARLVALYVASDRARGGRGDGPFSGGWG